MDLRERAQAVTNKATRIGPYHDQLLAVTREELTTLIESALREASAPPAGAAMFQGNANEVLDSVDLWLCENKSNIYRCTISKIEQGKPE